LGLNLGDNPSRDDVIWLKNFYKLAKKERPLPYNNC